MEKVIGEFGNNFELKVPVEDLVDLACLAMLILRNVGE